MRGKKTHKKLQVPALSVAYLSSNRENERTSGDGSDNTWTHIHPYWISSCFEGVCVVCDVFCTVYFFGFRKISLLCLIHLTTVTTAAVTVARLILVIPGACGGSWKDNKSCHIYCFQSWLCFGGSFLKMIAF